MGSGDETRQPTGDRPSLQTVYTHSQRGTTTRRIHHSEMSGFHQQEAEKAWELRLGDHAVMPHPLRLVVGRVYEGGSTQQHAL